MRSAKAPMHGHTPRAAALVVAAGLGLGGLAACGDSAGSESATTVEDLKSVEDQVQELSDRVGQLEDGLAEGGDGTGDTFAEGEANEFDRAFLSDPEVHLGQEVTVSGSVSDVLATTGQGGAFRIGGVDGAQEIGVVGTGDVPDLGVDDVVRVTGEVVVVERDRFEEDFGIAAGDLFEDEAEFFVEGTEQVALAASSVEVVDPEPANPFQD